MRILTRCCSFLLLLLTLSHILYASQAKPTPDQTLLIPMRDGTKLPTDIYLPHPEAKSLPCILLRGPAGRQVPSAIMFASLAQHGYVVAIQDSRAAADQEGKTLPFFSDGWGHQQDGYDTVQWLAAHPLTNGKIGTLGLSNMGITQILMAPTAPPALACQYIMVAASSLYHHAIYPGGQLLKNQVEGIINLYTKNPSLLKYVTEQPLYNDFWDNFNTLKVAHLIKAPAVHQGGWYDIFVQGTLDAFKTRQELGAEGAKGKQKLLIGPWEHHWPSTMKLGDFEVPLSGRKPPIDLDPKRWFDFYLKGIPNNVDEIPAVTYFVMGPFDGSQSSGNVWRTAETWPVPSKALSLYLTDRKELVETLPAKESTITYKHKTDEHIPTLGGRNLFLPSGPMDQRPIEERSDVVTFTTAPLDEDVEVTGQIFAQLVFSCEHEDTDVAVRLTDVYPDGRSILIADAMYRTGNMAPVAIDEKVKRLDIDLWSTSIVFAKGHRIRVSISGSNFPRFEKNLHGNKEVSLEITHCLHVGGKHPSQLILPIVRKGEKWLVDSK